MQWRLDGGGPVSRLLAPTPNPRIDRSGFDRDTLVVDYSRHEGEPGRHPPGRSADGRSGAFPGWLGLLPTDDPDDHVVVYDDGTIPRRLGLYSLSRRAPAGPVIDPGIPPDDFWSDGGVVGRLLPGTTASRFGRSTCGRVSPRLERRHATDGQ